MATGLLVSVKTKLVVAEETVCGNVLQINPGSWFVVHSTWNRSFVGAVQLSVVFVAVTTALFIDGGGITNIVKAFVALSDGKLLSVTTVVNLNSPPVATGAGLHVMMPLIAFLVAAVFFQVLFGFFRALSGVVAQATLMAIVPRHFMGRTQSAIAILTTVFQILMTFALGWVSHQFSLVAGFCLLALMYVGGTLSAFRARQLLK